MNAIDPRAKVDELEPADDAWLDEALAQSFPASDPLPVFHGDPGGQQPGQGEASVDDREE